MSPPVGPYEEIVSTAMDRQYSGATLFFRLTNWHRSGGSAPQRNTHTWFRYWRPAEFPVRLWSVCKLRSQTPSQSRWNSRKNSRIFVPEQFTTAYIRENVHVGLTTMDYTVTWSYSARRSTLPRTSYAALMRTISLLAWETMKAWGGLWWWCVVYYIRTLQQQ